MSSYALSHQSRHRLRNEDAYLIQSELGLYIVADGISSMQESGIASDWLVKPFSSGLAHKNFIDCFDAIKCELLRRHYFLYEKSLKLKNTLGTTLALMVLKENRVGILSAGDSRIYRYDRLCDVLEQLTEDDVSGKAITRALGVESSLNLHQQIFARKDQDVFLLCSDGLYKKVSSNEMQYILKHYTGYDACHRLIELALGREAKDNITVLVYDAA